MSVSIYDAYLSSSPVAPPEEAARLFVQQERAAGTTSGPVTSRGVSRTDKPSTGHFKPDDIKLHGASTVAREMSLSQRVQQLGDEAVHLEEQEAAWRQLTHPAPIDADAYFTPLSAQSHFPPPPPAQPPTFESGLASRVDPAEFFTPTDAARLAAAGGHTGRYSASSKAMLGKAMKSRMDLGYERVQYGQQRAGSGEYRTTAPPVSTRPISAPRSVVSQPTAVPASLTGMPLSYYGVSGSLTPGQARIQQKWLDNIGVASDAEPQTDGPMSARSPRKSRAANTAEASRQVTAATDGMPATGEFASYSSVVPPIALPVHTWEPVLVAEKPALHTHQALPLRTHGFEPHAPPPPAAQSSSNSSRPTSSSATSRSSRTRAVAAAADRPHTAGGRKATGATPITSFSARPVAPSFRGTNNQMADLQDIGVNATSVGAAAYAAAPQPAVPSRPSSSSRHPASSAETPHNVYARAFYVADEKDDPDADVDAEFENEFRLWSAQEKAGVSSRRPSAASRVGSVTSRPSSTIRSRPLSSASTARSRSRPSSGVQYRIGGSGSQSSRGAGSQQHLQLYDRQTLVSVRDHVGDFAGAQFHQRASGLLLTTRAKPPFSARAGETAHSSLPLSALSLRPNAGFQTELVVAHDLLHEFTSHALDERAHFYSPALFWDFKLAELLRATEEEHSASAAGARLVPESTHHHHASHKAKKIIPASDHVYPNTYRTLCASAILKQVVPTLTMPVSGEAASSDGPDASPPPSATQTLLATSLDLLHRSIYQPAGALVPPPPPAHVLDPDLARAVNARNVDREDTESFDHDGSHADATAHISSQSHSTSAASGGAPVFHASSAFAVPFFLSTKYLYESNQQVVTASEKTSEKILRVEGRIGKIYQQVNRRVCRVTFHIWRTYVKMQKQKANLSVYLTKTALSVRSRRDPFLIFAMWKAWTARGKLKRQFRASLKEMQGQIRSVSRNLHQHGAKDAVVLQEYLGQIQQSFQALQSDSKFTSTPVDIFSPMMLTLLLERYESQLQLISSLHYVDLLPLCDSYSQSSDLSVESDMIMSEISRIGNHELSEVRSHLLAKLESVSRRESNQEVAMMESLLYISGEDFIFKWVNRHLSETQAGVKLEDLAELATNTEIYAALLKSIAPNVVDSVSKYMLAGATTGGGGGGGGFSSLTDTSSTATSDAESRDIGMAKMVLEVCSTLGCLPVITLEEFLAHPTHRAHLDRVAADKLRANGAAKGDADAAATTGGLTAPSGDSFDPAQFYSSHPADAGLTASELGHPVDEHGQPLHARRHMFDDLATDLLPQDEPDSKHAKRGGATGDEGGAGTNKYMQDPSLPVNAHLHLCLLASLFLQRPSLPITSAHSSAAFTQDGWLESTRARLATLSSEWDVLKDRRDVSIFGIQAFLSGVGHIGLEVDILMQRAQRRSRAFDQVVAKMEDLLWTLQKRKSNSGTTAATGGGGGATTIGADGIRRANLTAEVPLYSEIPMAKILDVLSHQEESLRDYAEIKTILGEHYGELANIFRHYSALRVSGGSAAASGGASGSGSGAPSPSATINFTEFMVLIVDCHLLSKRVSKGTLHVLFTRCAQSVKEVAAQSSHLMPYTDADRLEHSVLNATEKAHTTAEHDDAEKTNEEQDQEDGEASATSSGSSRPVLSQAGLFEAFIRLGALKYHQLHSVPDRLRRILENDVLPHACRLKLDEFRAVLSRDRVKNVFATHKLPLQAIFQHFAKDQDDTAETNKTSTVATRGKLMNRAGFMRMAQDAQIIASGDRDTAGGTTGAATQVESESPSAGVPVVWRGLSLNEFHLSSLIAHVLRLPESATRAEFDMSYQEFLECLGAIAVQKDPNPYQPIQVKIDNFLTHMLMPTMRKSIRRVHQILTTAEQAAGSRATARGNLQ